MMENLIIAKARQDALQRKMEERRLRLQEEANRRFAASGAMTAEEKEQRLLYTNVLEYEQDHDWPKQWKTTIKNSPDSALVSDLVSYLLSRSDHPVVKLLRKHQYRVYNRLYPLVSKSLPQSLDLQLRPSSSNQNLLHPELHSSCEKEQTHATVERENSFEDLETFLTEMDWTPPEIPASDSHQVCDSQKEAEQEGELIQEMETRALKEHLRAIVKDVHIAIDQLLSLCLLSFECLNTASARDVCLASIEEVFFTPLWSALMALFRKVYRDREMAFQASMRLYCDSSPVDVGVPSKLLPQDLDLLQGSYPYESAVQELRLLVQNGCPQRKLECIVRTLRLICACAEDYRCLNEGDTNPNTAAIGADDLLPILSFVAVRCQCPQLLSECAALEEFIHEGYLIGEEGYCLTSMQSALAYIESLHAEDTKLAANM